MKNLKKGLFGALTIGAGIGAGTFIFKKLESVKAMYDTVDIVSSKFYDFEEFEGESLGLFLSSGIIDLRYSEFLEDEVYLDLYGNLSKITIIVPDDVEVISEGTKKLSCLTEDVDDEIEKSKTLFINYDLTLSKVEILDDEAATNLSNECGCNCEYEFDDDYDYVVDEDIEDKDFDLEEEKAKEEAKEAKEEAKKED